MSNQPEIEKPITFAQLIEWLPIGRSSINKLTAAKKIRYYQFCKGGERMFFKSEVIEDLKRCSDDVNESKK